MKEISLKELKNKITELYNSSEYDEVLVKHIAKVDAKQNLKRKITKDIIEKQRQYDISTIFEKLNDLNKAIRDYPYHDKRKVYDAAYNATKMHLTHSHRESGGPYVTHPLYVAYIIADMNLDIETIIAALYHDIIEDEDYTGEDIRRISNGVIENLVQGLSKLDTNNNKKGSKINELDKVERDSIYLQNQFKYMKVDIRIIFVKLADRLHNMETLYAKKVVSQKRISRQTLYIFAPVAKKLGMYKIANRLEDLAFKYLYPSEYEKMSQIRTDLGNDDEDLNELVLKVDGLLKPCFNYSLRTRIKHTYGIFKHSLDDEDLNIIPDLRAIKVIIDDSGDKSKDIENCKKVVDILKSNLKRYNKIIDYTTKAKIDGYMAIIMEIDNIEIQIMTRGMYNISRWGIAGYYKNIPDKKEALRQIKLFLSNNKNIDDIYEEIGQDNFIIRSKIIGKGNVFITNENGNEIFISEGTTISNYLNTKNIIFNKHDVYVNDVFISNPNYILKMEDKINIKN